MLSRIPGVSEISERAPFEGGFSISAEVKAISQVWDRATKEDIWETVKTGLGSLDVLYGTKTHLPPEALDFIGHLHGAVKVLPKRAEFFRRFEKGMEWARRNNLDINDPRVQSAVSAEAYQYSLRAILMQKNVVTSAFNGMMGYLHNNGASGKAVENVAKFFLPIVHVPTNFIAESLQFTPPSLAWQTMQVFRVLTDKDKMGRSAMDNLKMHDMDNIMRGLKKGSVGLAFLALGFGIRNSITGYFRPGKKQAGDPPLGSIKVAGVAIPIWLAESPPFMVLQMGATTGHVWDYYNMKGMSGGLLAGSAYAGIRTIRAVPFLETPARIAEETQTPEKTGVWLGHLAASLLMPLGLSQIAEWTDPSTAQRKPQTPGQAIKMAIPGLREQVPTGGGRFHISRRGK